MTKKTEFQKVKIVATLGPASESAEMILELAKRGVNMFRINLSHATVDEVRMRIKRVRAAERQLGKPLAVLGDLAGPKIRIGDVKPNFVLHAGQVIKVFAKPVIGSEDGISINIPSILKHIEPGAEIFLDDGLLKLEVEKVSPDCVHARVLFGGLLKPRKSFSVHGIIVENFSLSAKDKSDIKLMVAEGADMIAVSFVQTHNDINAVKKLLPRGKAPFVIAKIETPSAVQNIESITEAADGIMIARGDLGLAVPMSELPHIQKYLTRIALRHGKPVITATQMLESMTHNPLPTRAEVADVANAIVDGTDAIMLSGETAGGKHPAEVVKMMAEIVHTSVPHVEERTFPDQDSATDAVSASAVKIAEQTGSKLIIAFTQSGTTARRIARHKPHQPIIALTPSAHVIRELAISWGIYSMPTKLVKNLDAIIEEAKRVARNNPVYPLKKGESFIICAGVPFGQAGTSNWVLVQKV